MTSNITRAVGQGACPTPFLQEDLFPATGGFTDGRFCSSILGPSCCLPCPQTEWLYPDNFDTITRSANWINVVSLVCIAFLLLSFAVLPVGKTHRHYLSVCLAIAITFMNLGFIVPLGTKPNQCLNAITPNDMTTSASCASSGAFLILGGWGAVTWVFIRAVALHLQICWQVVIGKTFMWGALASGWVVPIIGVSMALVFSGVSFRFGETCHINHKNSLADLWIPLLAFAGITMIVQFATFGYCIKVYLASLSDDSTTTENSGLPSYTNSVRGTISPKQAYRRVRRVIELQWRGIAIVLLIIADVVFFAVVFVYMDDNATSILKSPLKSSEWLVCLIKNEGRKNECLDIAAHFVVNEATIMAVLLLLSLNGVWCLFLLGRWSIITGWLDMIRGKMKPDTEFVSADVHQYKDPGTYEMLGRDRDMGKSPEPLLVTPSINTPLSPLEPTAARSPKSGHETPDYFGREARYKSPVRSFSSPKPPSGGFQKQTGSWDSTSTAHVSSPPPPAHHGMDPLGMNKI
ncbi:G protein-like protein-coupled receptor : GPCR, secretin-like protein [Amylocarpus encephaloides]|uniref:G protein-like protein-coupled receptor: GPCR, secretin-like protein n=1 Tax=Amylocarpus encephaloides TaxID=45428 RepID=A0A9P8C904_9HELO|nr:G protein-like protein-coupled receptor : GPCR, secretin-like protein [Amylocarpus encephaloides]